MLPIIPDFTYDGVGIKEKAILVQVFQATLKQTVVLSGHGVHGGQPSELVIKPAKANSGIVFIRHVEGQEHRFQALSGQTGATSLFTSLGQGEARIETIEHLMAAIAAFGLDNLEIEVSDHEVPILDGASRIYADAFKAAGIVFQEAARRYLVVKQPVRVERGEDYAEFLPYDGCRFDVTIAFASPAIGTQSFVYDLDAETFYDELSRARTFGFIKDVETLWARGMALGSSLENSVVIGLDHDILNAGGLHYANEFVRHKMLDAIGDTALLGAPFRGIFRSLRGGHALNAQLVKKLLETEDSHDFQIFSENYAEK